MFIQSAAACQEKHDDAPGWVQSAGCWVLGAAPGRLPRCWVLGAGC